MIVRKIVLLVILFLGFLCAEKDTTNVYLVKGSFSLQFQINQQIRIRDFQGTFISAKYLFSDKSAIRFGISVNYDNHEKNTGENTIFHYVDETILFSIDINTQYLYHITTNQLSLYSGFGTVFSYGYSSEKNSVKEYMQQDFQENSKTYIKNYGTGISFVIGGEYFTTRYLSILVEYGTTFQYFYTNISDLRTGVHDNRGYEIKPSLVKFGFSLNF